MKPIIKTEEENKVALAFVERLMDGDPEPESKEGKLLSMLADEIQVFEKRYTSTPTTPSSGEEHLYNPNCFKCNMTTIIWQPCICGRGGAHCMRCSRSVIPSPTTNGEGENKIITTIEQDRERFLSLAKYYATASYLVSEESHDRIEESSALNKLDSHLSLSIEHVLESLKEEVEARKYTFEKVDWGDGITSDEPVERKDVSLTEAKGHNLALSSVSTLIGEVIKHVKK